MDALQEIDALVAHEDRWAGTEGERQAGEHPAERLRSLGRDAEIEEAVVRPDYALTYVLPDRLDPQAPERAFEFCSQLIERMDRQPVVRRR